MSNQTKDAAKERAVEEIVSEYAYDHSVPRAVLIEAGYDAALARTCTWTWEEDNSHPFASAYQTDCGVMMQESTKGFCSHCGGKVEPMPLPPPCEIDGGEK